jgi:hypothetical protein
MGLLLRHADRLADLVLRVALAINAELLCEDLLVFRVTLFAESFSR